MTLCIYRGTITFFRNYFPWKAILGKICVCLFVRLLLFLCIPCKQFYYYYHFCTNFYFTFLFVFLIVCTYHYHLHYYYLYRYIYICCRIYFRCSSIPKYPIVLQFHFLYEISDLPTSSFRI